MIAQAPAAVVQIAQRVSTQERGAIVYRLHRVFDVHAGPMHRHDDYLLAIAVDGTKTIKVRVIRATIGGKTADAATVSKIEDQWEHPKAGDVFHRPFDQRYLAEYTYEQVNPQTYHFTSSIHDAAHGSGTFSVDAAGNVVKYQYTPNVLPQYTSSATIDDTRSQVLPAYWGLTGETQQYSGHYAIFGGGATTVLTFDGYAHYTDSAAAIAALQGISER
jgi:hypothetical protein